MDKIKIRIGVIGISDGAGETFVSDALNYYLNLKDAPKVFVSRPERFEILDGPNDIRDLDYMIGVIDPLPSKVKSGLSKYTVLKNMENVIWLVNKDNPGVDHRELKRFLELDDFISQEVLRYEDICRAEYNLRDAASVLDLKGIRKIADTIRKDTSELL